MYESGIIDSSFGGGLDCADGCAMLLCSGDSEEPERVREAVLSRAEALLREGIGADYFLRMKRSALGRRIKGLDSFDGTASGCVPTLAASITSASLPSIRISPRKRFLPSLPGW